MEINDSCPNSTHHARADTPAMAFNDKVAQLIWAQIQKGMTVAGEFLKDSDMDEFREEERPKLGDRNAEALRLQGRVVRLVVERLHGRCPDRDACINFPFEIGEDGIARVAARDNAARRELTAFMVKVVKDIRMLAFSAFILEEQCGYPECRAVLILSCYDQPRWKRDTQKGMIEGEFSYSQQLVISSVAPTGH